MDCRPHYWKPMWLGLHTQPFLFHSPSFPSYKLHYSPIWTVPVTPTCPKTSHLHATVPEDTGHCMLLLSAPPGPSAPAKINSNVTVHQIPPVYLCWLLPSLFILQQARRVLRYHPHPFRSPKVHRLLDLTAHGVSPFTSSTEILLTASWVQAGDDSGLHSYDGCLLPSLSDAGAPSPSTLKTHPLGPPITAIQTLAQPSAMCPLICFRAVWPLLVQLGTDFKCACVLSRFSRVRLFACSSVHGILQARMLQWVASFLLQGIFQTQGLNPCLLCLLHCRQIPYPLSHRGSLTLSGASLSFWILHL